VLVKANRLTKRGSFKFVYNNGAHTREGALSLTYVKGRTRKVGFSVSNKLGKAIVRNKLKRRLRSVVRGLIPRMAFVQAVVSAKPGAETLTYAQLSAAVIKLFTRAGLLSQITQSGGDEKKSV
jgi:ribonuclease P protein component